MRPTKRILSTVLCVALLFCTVLNLSACSIGNGKRIIRISNGQPESHPDNVGLRAFKQYVEENLGDKYEVQIYPNELLGSSAKALELLQTGAIEYVVCSTSNLETFDDIYQLFSLPYLFKDKNGYDKVIADEDFMDSIYKTTDASGFRAVAAYDAGVRNVYATKPIYTPADLKGLKIRVQASPTNIEMINRMGGAAVAMSYSEVYTGIQSGVINGAENSELALVTMKHGEVANYYTYTQHQIVPDLLVANVRFLDGLSEEEAAVFEEAAQISAEVEAQAWAEQIETAKNTAAQQMGVTFIDADTEAFRQLVLPLHEKVLSENPKLQPYYDKIQEIQNEK